MPSDVSPLFIGIVLLAVVGGAAESGAAIAMARKNQMDLASASRWGSSLQIALFVTPVLVLSSRLIAPEPLTTGLQSPRDRALAHGSWLARDRRRATDDPRRLKAQCQRLGRDQTARQNQDRRDEEAICRLLPSRWPTARSIWFFRAMAIAAPLSAAPPTTARSTIR